MIILTINTTDRLDYLCGRIERLLPFGISGVLFVGMKRTADRVFSQRGCQCASLAPGTGHFGKDAHA